MSSRATPLVEREHVVYRFYNSSGVLLYVGMTSDLPARLRQHAARQPWWAEVAEIASKAYPDQNAAAAAELLAIISERPLHNRAMNYGQVVRAINDARNGKARRVASAAGVGAICAAIGTVIMIVSAIVSAMLWGPGSIAIVVLAGLTFAMIIGTTWEEGIGEFIRKLVNA